MKKFLLVALVGLAGCSMAPDEDYPALECTVDDSLSFTAVGVRESYVEHGVMYIHIAKAPVIQHRLADGETCQRVPEINWDLAK